MTPKITTRPVGNFFRWVVVLSSGTEVVSWYRYMTEDSARYGATRFLESLEDETTGDIK